MKIFALDRVPEPEVMDASDEVEAYASASAQEYLQKIDATFVEHVSNLFWSRPAGTAVDIGCGPGQIPAMMARRFPALDIAGIDAAPHMIEQARADAARQGVNVRFEVLRVASDGRLPFPDAAFDLVTCNSVMHHLADPVSALNEMARIAKPDAAILIRDLRRPSKPAYPLHVRWFGRHYSGKMRELYEASVRAAYTVPEFEALLRRSKLFGTGATVFTHAHTHIGIERPSTR